MNGHKSTSECWQNVTSPSCLCTVELPQLFESSSSSLFYQRFIPIVAAHVVLQDGTPLTVKDAMRELLTAPMLLDAAACIAESTTSISESTEACSAEGTTLLEKNVNKTLR